MRQRLPLIKQPVIVFQGRKDTTVDATAGNIILQGVNSTYTEHHWMERSSHAITIDCELDTVADLTVRFMEKVLQSQ
ncbi:MAG: hypothetical protein IPL71_03525 [Anaerolineales bacterium]|uniref:alpha/beta hydrolase n=1 Tax=Candidatus Villigracilis proximus TaxID=3140683 RepID=UPI003135419E|nr:hypothetical protein [Anaerolineales bacterium]